MLGERLAEAERLGPGHPRTAAICRGIISLYTDKEWAARLVENARSLLRVQVESTSDSVLDE
jgi:hypothetical protein